jgi:Ca2+-binding RTX toxin-like protein
MYEGKDQMKLKTIFVSVAAVGLMVGPAFAHGLGSVAGAAKDCTIQGTAADDSLTGTTRADVICSRAGQDTVYGLEGNDTIRLGQGDDLGAGDDGSDVVKGHADDDQVCGNDQNDKLYGGQGDDDIGGFEADNISSECYEGFSGQEQGENGNDFLKSRDNVSGNDALDGGNNTDTCVIDAGDVVTSCEQ